MVTWDIDGLAERVAAALARADVRAPNGRVSQVPDRRAIRWYATIGLVDPPLRTRGRTARYGERHLLQLIALKLRQSQGRTLTEIQAELAGANDARLREIAARTAIPADFTDPTPVPVEAAPRARFWAQQTPAAPPVPTEPADPPAPAGPPGPPAPAEPPQPPPPDQAVQDVTAAIAAAPAGPFYAMVLHPGATVLLPGPPAPGDLAAIRAAARPLLDLLASRQLLSPPLPTTFPAPAEASPTDPSRRPR